MKSIIKYTVVLSFVTLFLSISVSAQATRGKLLKVKPPTVLEKISRDVIACNGVTIHGNIAVGGQELTVKASFVNVSTKKLNRVVWRIIRENETLASGVRENVEPGATFVISARWVSTEGEHDFWGDADPDNELGEPQKARINNTYWTHIEIADDLKGHPNR